MNCELTGQLSFVPKGQEVGSGQSETLKGHEGHHVEVSAHVYADKNQIHAMSVKMLWPRRWTTCEVVVPNHQRAARAALFFILMSRYPAHECNNYFH
jgi:hypothetical protein